MRDIVITLIVFGSLPFIFKRAWFGIVMWVWISVMNPHRLSWGFAYSYPFAAIIAATTLVALVLTKEDKKLPNSPIAWTLIAFSLWMVVTTIFAFFPKESFEMLNRVEKTMLMTVVTMMLIKKKEHILAVVWTLAASIGYYGVKGGIFTAATGGGSIVWGPEGSYIEGNNEVALAIITIIPMMYFLAMSYQNKWIKRAMYASMALCMLSALGSYSRGALLGLLAMVSYLWWKSPKKILTGTLLLLLLPAAMAFMPDKWSTRMDTINTYKEDSSAMGRINAWGFATNLALDRPIVGGGYEIWTAVMFKRYGPNPDLNLAAHSIYFQALGEHGFVGLFLYLGLAFFTFRRCIWIVRMTSKRDDLKWASNLATMVQVSLLGFGVGGAFLSLVYYDVPYYLMALIVSTSYLVENTLKAEADAKRIAQADARRRPVLDAAAKALT